MTQAILFDLYGTLIELTASTHPYPAIARSLPAQHRAAAIDKALTTPGMSLQGFAEHCGIDADKTQAFSHALQADLARVRLFDDVLATLNTLRERGLKLALVSNLAEPYKEPVRRLGLEPYFDALIYSCDIGVRKPSPRIYEVALGVLGCTPDRAVMVGDSYRSDVTGPEALGITGIHLTRAGQPSQAGLQITSLHELLAPATQARRIP